jgi:hypothetical protein
MQKITYVENHLNVKIILMNEFEGILKIYMKMAILVL